MWLLKAKPPRVKRVCKFCAGPFGLMRPNFPYCSLECRVAVEGTPDELAELLRYPP